MSRATTCRGPTSTSRSKASPRACGRPTVDVGDLKRLVEPDRVHRAVYTDPALFELELERLFGRAWLLLGHESQVREPGEFFTTRMGREPVVVIRDTGGSVQVLVNRC